MNQRVRLTQRRIEQDTGHRPGFDYRNDEELLDDLRLLHASVREHQGALIAGGSLERAIRLVSATGFTLASMDFVSMRIVTTRRSVRCSTASAS